jgi:hypothetical protein
MSKETSLVKNPFIIILPITISAIAMFISVFQLVVSQKQNTHNIKIVEPKIELSIFDASDEIKISFKNKGLGPAYIESVKFIDCKGNLLNMYQFMDELCLLSGTEDQSFQVTHFGSKSIISSNEDFVWFSLSNKEIHSSSVVVLTNNIKKHLSVLNVEIKYADIYGNEQEAYKAKLFFKKY